MSFIACEARSQKRSILKELLHKQQSHLDFFFENLDHTRFDSLFKDLLSCRGTLFFTGVGKSGFIAQKIASTMMSTGTKAFFLSPIDAFHGDLGMISEEDFILIFSKSGETEELIQLLPYFRDKGARIIAITSNSDSRLVCGADFSLNLPCEKELCPFDLAPTISTEVQLLFGDVLTIALMEAKGFTSDAYAENHPGGRIGKRSSIKVKDLMLNQEITPLCFANDLLEEVLIDFTEKRCGCLIVIDEKRRLKGVFTDGDLRRALQAKGEHILKEKIGDLMTTKPKSIALNALAWDAMKLMESDREHPVMILPVVDEQKKEVVGIIKLHDLIQAGL